MQRYSTAQRATLFAVMVGVLGVPVAFGLTLVLSSVGLGAVAPYLAAFVVGILLGHRWATGLSGSGSAARALGEAALGTTAAGLVLVAVFAFFGGTGGATTAVLVVLSSLVGVAAAGLIVFRAGLGTSRGATAAVPVFGSATREVTMSEGALVGIIMGSQSDMDVMKDAESQLESLGVPFETVVASAHRQPDKVHQWAGSAEGRGLKVIIAAAGKAAHLGGVVAAYTTLPVICVPMKTSDLGGLDSLLSMVQMPTGVPVACVAINGAKNAAILATQILGTSEPRFRDAVATLKDDMAGA